MVYKCITFQIIHHFLLLNFKLYLVFNYQLTHVSINHRPKLQIEQHSVTTISMLVTNNHGAIAMTDRRQASTSITSDQLKLTLFNLHRRFPQYSVQDIVFSLSNHLMLKGHTSSLPNQQTINQAFGFRTRRTNEIRDVRQLRDNVYGLAHNNHDKQVRAQQLKVVARYFCDTGVNYSGIRYLIPQLSPQQYRCYLQTINNQAIQQVQQFLRYQCNIQIQYISMEQKRRLRLQLMKVREWLGPQHLQQLQTYYKFITRFYQHKYVEIGYQEARILYGTFLKFIKSPFVDIMEINQGDVLPINQEGRPYDYSKIEEKWVIQQYLKDKNLSRISDKLIRQRGNSSKWSVHALNVLLKDSLKRTIRKVIRTRERYLASIPIQFTQPTNAQIDMLLDSHRTRSLKQLLFKFYIANRVSVTGLGKIINKLNNFFKDDSESQFEVVDDGEVEEIPKRQFQSKVERQESNGQEERALKVEQCLQGQNIMFDEQEEIDQHDKQEAEVQELTAVSKQDIEILGQ